MSNEGESGGATASDGPYPWELCFKEENASYYCNADNTRWPCVPGKSYHPALQDWICRNFKYGRAVEALGFDGLGQPELVDSDPELAFDGALVLDDAAAAQAVHVMVGPYRPSANRTAGFGLTTNIINGGLECGTGELPDQVLPARYAGLPGVDVGPNLDCAKQEPYGS